MSVSEAELDAATPDQIKLAAQIYLLIVQKGTKWFLQVCTQTVQNVVTREAAIQAQVPARLLSMDQLEMSDRVLQRMLRSPAGDLGHRFPSMLDQEILEAGQLWFPSSRNGGSFAQVSARGSINRQDGIFELGIRPAGPSSGGKPQIVHRSFRADAKMPMITHEERQQGLSALQELLDDSVQLSKPAGSKPSGGGGGGGGGGGARNSARQTMAGLGNAALMGAGISAVFNIGELLSGNIVKYLAEVGKGAGFATINHGLSEALSSQLGEAAGPVGTIVIMAVFDAYSLTRSGDWARFGKNTVRNGASSLTGFAGMKAGAALGAMGGGPIGAIIGGIAGGIACGFGGYWITGKTRLASPTLHELRELGEIERKSMAALREQLTQQHGVVLADDLSLDDLQRMIEHGTIAARGNWHWEQLAASVDQQQATGLVTKAAFRLTLKPIFLAAKLRSPMGCITDGLRLILADLQSSI